MPAAGASQSIVLAAVAWLTVGQALYIAGAGSLVISAINVGTLTVTAFNDASPGNAVAATNIASGAAVSISSRRGSRFVGSFANQASLPTEDGYAVAPGDWACDTAGNIYQWS
jgi:hypothetical protein